MTAPHRPKLWISQKSATAAKPSWAIVISAFSQASSRTRTTSPHGVASNAAIKNSSMTGAICSAGGRRPDVYSRITGASSALPAKASGNAIRNMPL